MKDLQKEHTARRTQIIQFVMSNKALFILLVLVLIAALLQPRFLTQRNLYNVLKQVAAATVMGMGYSFVLGSGNMDLSVGLLLGMLGIVAAKLDTTFHLPFGVLLLILIAIGAICGMTNAFFVNLFGLPAFIVTLAMGQVFKGINYVVSNTSAISGLSSGFSTIGQGTIPGLGFPIPVAISIVITLVVCVVVYRTAFGRHVLAMGANVEAARVSGLSTKRIRYGVYCMMGICVAIAAMIVTGRAGSAQPQAGQGMEMDAIAAVVIGGTPLGGGYCRPEGTFFGCLIIGLINNILNLLSVNSSWQLVAKGAIILFAIILDSQSAKILEKQRLKAVA